MSRMMISMGPPTIDRKVVEELIQRASEQLEGDWILVGGALALVWLDSPRATRDVDLFSKRGTLTDRLALMDLAVALHLPIEAVNPAADYFVRKIPGWDHMVEPLCRGSRATVFRPTPTLFVLLKMHRLSESDLDDCELLFRRASEHRWAIDAARLKIEALSWTSTNDAFLQARRQKLLGALDTYSII